MDEKIVLTVRAYGITHTAELNEDAVAFEFIERCTQLAESIGYSPELVQEALAFKIETLE
jgi:hypothetical protein